MELCPIEGMKGGRAEQCVYSDGGVCQDAKNLPTPEGRGANSVCSAIKIKEIDALERFLSR